MTTAHDFLTAETKAQDPNAPVFDRWGRYKIPHPADPTGPGKAWTRASTVAKAISDQTALGNWKLRMALQGSTQFDLTEVNWSDKSTVDRLAQRCMDAAGANDGATGGTKFHYLTECYDLGKPLPNHSLVEARMLQGYKDSCETLGVFANPAFIEQTVAVPDIDCGGSAVGVAGTFDRVVQSKRTGKSYVWDFKDLDVSTKLPTPYGWTTMGNVQVGDEIFDAYGNKCRVTGKSEIKRNGTKIVRFSDGSEVISGPEHIWWTQLLSNPTVNGKSERQWSEPEARPLQDIEATLRYGEALYRHRVPVAGCLTLPEADLPIDPYLLGCWLGDGTSMSGQITKGYDLFDILVSDGHELGVESNVKENCLTRSVKGLTKALRINGLKGNKHIPTQYLRASEYQRRRLLQGLMDTDGSWNTARNRAVFSTSNKTLANQVLELLRTLGEIPKLVTYTFKGFGKTGTAWRVEFSPNEHNPFRLPCKADKVTYRNKWKKSSYRTIVDIVPGPDVETQCIMVDSPTHTYLCGEEMIPTHNTTSKLSNASYSMADWEIQLAIYAQATAFWSWEDKRFYDLPKIEQDFALVFHVERGTGDWAVYKVDLEAGRQALDLACRVRAWRQGNQGLKITPVTTNK